MRAPVMPVHNDPSAERTPRDVDLVVISDVHLGTRSCKAEQLDAYLAGLRPAELVLNGDIVDLREAHKRYWPAAHSAVVRRILGFAAAGTSVFYVTGNHDEALRRFTPVMSGGVQLVDSLERELGGRRTWIVHGDGIEAGMPVNRLLRRVGCHVYHAIRGAERWIARTGIAAPELVRALKSTARATAHIARYEEACATAAQARGYDAVVTGHIHAANLRDIQLGGGAVRYLNSGDWVDSMTALEHHGGCWRLARFGEAVGVEAEEPAEVDAERALA
jgi:UDP-2,3-diacylglucosamine pyrophosphatase LpxH